MPWLIIVVCWAHQINLIVGNYLSLQVDFLTCVPKALLVIKWTNSHSCALGIFHREQLQMFNKFLSLILPVITQWTAHFLSLHRLLEVEISMRASWMKYSTELVECIGPKADVQQKVQEIQAIVEDLQFWKWVKKYVAINPPLCTGCSLKMAGHVAISNLSPLQQISYRDQIHALIMSSQHLEIFTTSTQIPILMLKYKQRF
jgi:hypothetical protein